MKFTRLEPHPRLTGFIECYWVLESDAPEPRCEKIIPDGFTEVIFHFGCVYRAQISGEWETQAMNLLAGQLTRYFYLENTGPAHMLAIKLKPAALTQLFGLDMAEFTDRVVDLAALPQPVLLALRERVAAVETEAQAKDVLDEFFLGCTDAAHESPVTQAIQLVFETNGMATVGEMAGKAGVGERQLERLFRKYVGLSPKYYARIIRFNYIFRLIQDGHTPWSEIVYRSGYYDQSHFIRNFKAFTGEDPTDYYFEEKNMANFFLKKGE